jgi:trans-aconitate 2-methyltransferase
MTSGDGRGDMWDPDAYLRHLDVRLRPILDLLARVDHPRPRRVVDLGCGPGNVTALLASRWRHAHVLGIDTSPAMLTAARTLARPRQLMRRGSLQFRAADLRQWEPAQPVDIILANSALQWIPGHRELLLPRFAGYLAPGGVLGIQMPVDSGHADQIMFDLCSTRHWHAKLADVPALRTVDDPVDYLLTLTRAGLRADTWEATYTSVLPCADDRDGITELCEGTMLRPVLQRLGENEARRFLAEFTARIREIYPRIPLAGQEIQILPQRRAFAIGHKPT